MIHVVTISKADVDKLRDVPTKILLGFAASGSMAAKAQLVQRGFKFKN